MRPEERRLLRRNLDIENVKIRRESMNFIHLVQYRGQWQAVVNTEMNNYLGGREFINVLSDYQILKDSAPCSF
jgi:hypothetical protein